MFKNVNCVKENVFWENLNPISFSILYFISYHFCSSRPPVVQCRCCNIWAGLNYFDKEKLISGVVSTGPSTSKHYSRSNSFTKSLKIKSSFLSSWLNPDYRKTYTECFYEWKLKLICFHICSFAMFDVLICGVCSGIILTSDISPV